MRELQITIALLLVAVIPLAGSTAPATPIPLATVNGEIITDIDLKESFVSRHGGHTTFLGGDVETRRFLKVVIDQRLLIQEAYELGLDQHADVKPQVDELRARKTSEYLLKQEIDGKAAPSDAEVLSAYAEAANLYLGRELVVDTREEAESVRRSLMLGSDFEAFARLCSISPTRNRGGNLTPFTWGSLTPEIEHAVKSLEPGAISDVFRCKDGWRIVQLIDRIEAHRPELDHKVRARISAKLTERGREFRAESFARELWTKYGAKILPAELTANEMRRLRNSSPEGAVAVWNGGQLLVKEAFTDGELRMFASFTPGRAQQKIEETLRAAVNTQLVRLEAAARKIDEVPEVAREVAKFETKLMEGVLNANHVAGAVKVTEDEVRKSYEAQKSRMMIEEKRRIAHIAVKTEQEAKQIIARINKGEDFDEIVSKSSLDTASAKSGGDAGWVSKGKVDAPFEPLFKLAKGGVAKQPVESGGVWHVLRVTDIAPEHPLSFDEAKEKVEKTVFEKKKYDAREAWIAKLRAASEVVIDDAGVKKFVEANPYKDPNEKH